MHCCPTLEPKKSKAPDHIQTSVMPPPPSQDKKLEYSLLRKNQPHGARERRQKDRGTREVTHRTGPPRSHMFWRTRKVTKIIVTFMAQRLYHSSNNNIRCAHNLESLRWGRKDKQGHLNEADYSFEYLPYRDPAVLRLLSLPLTIKSPPITVTQAQTNPQWKNGIGPHRDTSSSLPPRSNRIN